MEQDFRLLASAIALVVESAAILVVAIGAGQALYRLAFDLIPGGSSGTSLRRIWIGFAAWILLALEFALGADIIRTAIAPSWDDLGKLAAIAAIRTGLSFFLSRDVESVLVPKEEPRPQP